MNFNGLRIIITGAGAGFGKEMALQLSKQGARIAAIDINPLSLQTLKHDCPEIQTWVCNVADNIQVEKAVDEIFVALGGLEVLINNAGIMKNAPLVNLLNRAEKRHPVELWENVIAVNQSSVFYMTRACADNMINKRCKGVVINISSISAQGNIGQTAYSASKAAVEAMTKVWAKELGRFGIRSVAIAPGFMDTAGTHDAIEERILAQWIEKTPLRRTGTIDEVVKTVLFTIENDFVNGVIISVNGGITI
jgi:3-oxoacyl-[acyl-carrier protein] reductase